MTLRGPVTLTVDGDLVLVTSPDTRANRIARLFFQGVLGAQPTENGWRCPRRRGSIQNLVVRINTFLESNGWAVNRVGEVDQAVQREIERKHSFQRTRESATAFRQGQLTLSTEQVKVALRNFGWNENSRRLLQHQENGLVHALTAINAANFSVPGSGKTATALAVAATHLATRTIDIVLVVGPLSCFRPWEKEVNAALPNKVTPKRIRGSAQKRRLAYANAAGGDLILISYATAAADRLALTELCNSFRVMLIVDESHRIKRFKGGLWAPALLDISRQARIRMILSGTPMPQSGKDLYSQLNVLWPSGELTGPRDGFASRIDRDLRSVLTDIQPFVSRTAKAALGLPEYQVSVEEVKLRGLQAEIYELIESNFKRRIEDAHTWKEKLDALHRGRPIRLLQAASNPATLNANDSYYRLPKLESANPTLMERLASYDMLQVPAKSLRALELVQTIASEGEKVVCWSNFIHNLDHFSRLVTQNLGLPVFQVDGRVPAGDETRFDDPVVQPSIASESDTRERIIERFLTYSGPAVLVTNPASCSESISLHTGCQRAIYLDRTFDCALFLQSVDRIHRLGLPPGATVQVYILNTTLNGHATIDGVVQQALIRKELAMRQLLEGADLQPFNLSEDALEVAEGDQQDLEQLLRFLLGEGM